MSKNFELLKQAGISLGTAPTLTPSTAPVLPRGPVPAIRSETKIPEWMLALRILAKHWRLSALFAMVTMMTVTIVTFSMRPVYEPTTRIEIDPAGETFSLTGNSGGTDAEYMETQAQNLKGDKLAIAVIRKLHLDQNPDFVQPAQATARSSALSTPAPASVVELTRAENAALSAFRPRLIVRRDTSSRLISISFAAHDPQLAAQITNTVVDTFIEQTYREQHDSIMKSTEWLSKQLDDIRQRMEESNRVLAQYQQTIGVADVDDNKNTFAEQMAALSRELTQAQADRIQLEALLSSVRSSSADSLPEVHSNPVVQQLSEKLADLRGQLSQAMVIYGKNHPTVKKLQSQVDELQRQLDAEKHGVLTSLRTSYAAAHAREALMDQKIKGTTQQMSQIARYNALKKEAQANAELYNTLYARVKESGIAAASRSSNLRVVDEARVLQTPTKPNRILNLGVGLMVALLGGVGIAFLREQFDSRIFTPEDVRQWIGSANVAVVPLFFGSNKRRQLPPPAPRLGSGADYHKLAPGIRFLLEQPHSPEAEAVRSLYTSIMLARPADPPLVTLVVSSFPGEGKTTVASNLAIAMSHHGSTCLVDADLRRGRIAAAFGTPGNPGLTDVLAGSALLDQAFYSVPSVPNLTVLPAHAGNVQAGQLACSEAMQGIVQELRQRFRFVVIDCAPLLPFADARSLSTLADGIVFVGRVGVTTHEVARRSMELLQELHSAPILEFVLNGADINSAAYRYYRYTYDYPAVEK